jgi:broad specificity phosphatase PhoE
MLTVFYSPHSTSVDNEAGRASGHADVALSTRGEKEAQRLREHYAAQAVDAVFCSDLQRASRTAEIVFSGRGMPIIQDKRLREFDYGDLTQTPRDQLRLEQYLTEPFPNGESILAAVGRVGDFVQAAVRDYDGKTIVVISHSAARYALEYFSGSSTLEAIIKTTWEWLDVPIWRYEFDDSFSSLKPLFRLR